MWSCTDCVVVSLYAAVCQEGAGLNVSLDVLGQMFHGVLLHCNSYEPFSLAEPLIRCCFGCSGASQLFLSCLFQGKVKVRRASISEPSDTEHEPQALPLSAGEACLLPQ